VFLRSSHFSYKCRYRRAQLALQKGDEELAREALKRRKSYAVGTILIYSSG
jgi:phage shock protein A